MHRPVGRPGRTLVDGEARGDLPLITSVEPGRPDVPIAVARRAERHAIARGETAGSASPDEPSVMRVGTRERSLRLTSVATNGGTGHRGHHGPAIGRQSGLGVVANTRGHPDGVTQGLPPDRQLRAGRIRGKSARRRLATATETSARRLVVMTGSAGPPATGTR